MPNVFVAAFRLSSAQPPPAYTGTAADALDNNPATACDLYLTGSEQSDYLRLDTGAAGQSIGKVTLQSVFVNDAQHPFAVVVSDASAPQAGGDIPAATVLTPIPAIAPGTADYTFAGQSAGRYVWVRLTLPPGSSSNSRMTIGGPVSWDAPVAPTLTAVGQLVNGQPAIVLTVT